MTINRSTSKKVICKDSEAFQTQRIEQSGLKRKTSEAGFVLSPWYFTFWISVDNLLSQRCSSASSESLLLPPWLFLTATPYSAYLSPTYWSQTQEKWITNFALNLSHSYIHIQARSKFAHLWKILCMRSTYVAVSALEVSLSYACNTRCRVCLSKAELAYRMKSHDNKLLKNRFIKVLQMQL